MIVFNEISKGYGEQTLFRQGNLLINRGEKCALVGHNGAGKSTLLRLLIGEESLDGGEITLPKGYRIGYLRQHLQMTQPTVREEGALGLRPESSHEVYRVEAILFGLGFTEEDLDKPPQSFSGGYQIRILLCQLLVAEPDCLLLDEPSNYLDIIAIRWLIKFLQKWRGELIIISHDRALLDAVSTHTIGVHRHKLRKTTGGTEAYFEQLLQEEEIYEKTRANLEKKKEHLQSFIDRFGAKATKAAQAQSRAKAIAKMPALEKLAQLDHLDFNFKYLPMSSSKVIEAADISFKYRAEDSTLIDQFSLLVENKDKLAIIGKNGKGKSTLLQLLGNLLQPDKGQVKIAETARIGYFGQTHIDRLHPLHTVEQEIKNANPLLTEQEVRSICGVMMFSGDQAKKSIGVLSGGERSRVLLGKILATPCNLLLLDEPTNHLDMESVEALVSAIESFPGTVILVTHCEWILRRIPAKLLVCHQSRQEYFYGTYDDFLEKRGWEEERQVQKGTKSTIPALLQTGKTKSKGSFSLRKKIEETEKKIEELEKECVEYEKCLVEASQSQNSSALMEYSKKIDLCQKQINSLFEEYARLLEQQV